MGIMKSMVKDMQMIGKQFYLIAVGAAVMLAGCKTMEEQRWQAHEKELGRPFEQKYEAPFQQLRETHEQQRESPAVTQLPPTMEGRPEVVPPTPYTGAEPILFGIAVKDKNIPKGYVLSPYAPDRGLVDVTGFPPGSVVMDPYTDKMMKVPAPAEASERPKEQTLLKPAEETPVVSKLPQVVPPPSMEQ
jgi:hypothetical protein